MTDNIIVLTSDPIAIAENEALFVASRLQWRRRVAKAEGEEYARLMEELNKFLEVTAAAANTGNLSMEARERLAGWFEDTPEEKARTAALLNEVAAMLDDLGYEN
jgi:hypothetical protein